MKKVLCAVMLLCIMSAGASGSIIIPPRDTPSFTPNINNISVIFPDTAFREYVRARYDIDGNNRLSEAELAAVAAEEIIDCHGLGIKSLDGIERFTNLKVLMCQGNALTKLDLSKNKNLLAVWCNFNQNLKSIDLSGCSALLGLYCIGCSLEQLDLTGLRSLVSIMCPINKIKELRNISQCVNLQKLICDTNALTSLNLQNNSRLVTVLAGSNNLKELKVSGLRELYFLDCGYNRLESLDVSGCRKLYYLSFPYNTIKSIGVRSCPSLGRLICNANSLEQLDLSKNSSLEFLNSLANNLSLLELNAESMRSRLFGLRVSYNSLRALDLNEAQRGRIFQVGGSPSFSILYPDLETDIVNTQDKNDLWWDPQVIPYLNIATRTETATFAGISENGHMIMRVSDDRSSNGYVELHLTLSSEDERALSRLKNGERRTVQFYEFDLNQYLQPDQMNNLWSYRSSDPFILAGDSMGNIVRQITTKGLKKGVYFFQTKPATVEYMYLVGLNNPSTGKSGFMDVSIEEPATLSLNGHTYRIFNMLKDYQSAKQYCEYLGGHLATISSNQERELILELLKTGGSGNQYWLGGENENGSWRWIMDGETFNESIHDVRRHKGASIKFRSTSSIDIEYESGNTMTLSGNFSYMTNYVDQRDSSQGVYLQASLSEDRRLSEFLIKLEGYYPDRLSGFICEWEPSPTDFAKYSAEYEAYLRNPAMYHDNENFQGMLPEPIDMSHLADRTQAFSSSALDPDEEKEYDARKHIAMPPVRNQGEYRTCWAFAALGALEINYNKKTGGSSAPDLSELHMSWYKFAGDLQHGGFFSDAANFLQTTGTAPEADMPYAELLIDDDRERGKEIGAFYALLREPEKFTHPLKLVSSDVLNPTDKAEIKRFVKKRGTVAVSYTSSNDYYGQSLDGKETTYFYSGDQDTGSGHAVLIVGWDDNYSASNFTKQNPGGKGAWLVRNSWGTSRKWGASTNKDGYFWMSYAQKLGAACAFEAGIGEAAVSSYSNHASTATEGILHRWQANIFRAHENETINEVSFQTLPGRFSYEVYINILGNDYRDTAKPGTPTTPLKSGVMENAGVHPIRLPSSVSVKKGQYFSVIVKLTPSGDSSYPYVTAVSDTGSIAGGNQDNTDRILRAGKSFFALGDSKPTARDWKDGYNLQDAYDQDGRQIRSCLSTVTASDTVRSNSANPDNPGPATNPVPSPTPDNNGSTSSSGGGGGGCSTASCLAGLAAITIFILKRHSF